MDVTGQAPSAETGARAARSLAVFGVFLAAAVLATWPWAARLRDAVPDDIDTYVNTWRLWWSYHQTFTDPVHLFDGNIFYPHRDSLAFSETLYGVSVPLFPFFAAGLRPLAVHGVGTLLGLALSAWAAFRVARVLGAPASAAWVAGLAFGFAPYRLGQLNHVGAIWAAGMPFALEALVRFARARSARTTLCLAAALAWLGLTWVTWLLLAALPLAVSALVFGARERALRERRFWLLGGAALLAALSVLAPFLLAYRRVAATHAFVRSAEEATFFSGRPSNWLDVAANNRFWTALKPARMSGERRLCPGVFLLALAAAGLVLAPGLSPGMRSLALAGAPWALLGFVGSLGMHAPFHRFLWDWAPGFQSMRVPLRWAMVGLLGLALLAAAAVARARRPALFGALACAALLVEQRAWPLTLATGAPDPSPVARRLAALPLAGGVVELPARSPHLALYTLRAADHGKPLVDADSSFVPESSARVGALAAERPVPTALIDHFEALPASVVVLHGNLCTDEERAALERFLEEGRAAGRLELLVRVPPSDAIWRVTRTRG